MNDVNFRVWIKSRNRLQYLLGFVYNKSKTEIRIWYLNDDENIVNESFPVDNVILMQGLGIGDENKREIYEGSCNIDYNDETMFVITRKDGQFGYDIYFLCDNGSFEYHEFETLDSYFFDGLDFSDHIYKHYGSPKYLSIIEAFEELI